MLFLVDKNDNFLVTGSWIQIQKDKTEVPPPSPPSSPPPHVDEDCAHAPTSSADRCPLCPTAAGSAPRRAHLSPPPPTLFSPSGRPK